MARNTKKIRNISRREALGSALVGGVALGSVSCSKLNTLSDKDLINSYAKPQMPRTLLVNRERAHQIMRAEGLDAIICSRPENIYYLTNYYPQLAKMGMENVVYAILPLDINSRPILVIGEFEFYLAGAEGSTSNHVDLKLFTSPAEPELFADMESIADQLDAPGFSSFLPKQHDLTHLSPVEAFKREKMNRLTGDMGATSDTTMLKTLRDIPQNNKRFATDNVNLSSLIKRAGIDVTLANGEQVMRRIRLQKSTEEIALMRYAARANAEAGLAAAKTVRNGANFQDIRREYNRQCADRFLTPSFMVIDSVIPETVTREIVAGQSFAIDCVSHGQYYHGDYGRTVCVGEPTAHIARATSAIAAVWDDLLPQLKPGMRYSDIGIIASKIFKSTNSEAALICNPHSVGLQHTDEPSRDGAAYFIKDDLELLEGMIISVDLPVVDVGLGGSAHLEDLVLIGRDGAELLNDGGDRVIII